MESIDAIKNLRSILTAKSFVIVLFTMVTLQNVLGQTPPPNDDYANRIQLIGTDVTFSGTAAGASRDNAEQILINSAAIYDGGLPTVWWTWTAPVSGQVTVSLTSRSDGRIQGRSSYIAFWDFVDWEPDNDIFWGTTISGRALDVPGYAQFSFYAEAGTNYDIEVSTAPYGSFTFHLVQKNAPLISVPPRDRAVAVGDYTFFGVIPGGAPPFQYQWRFNGVDLDGKTNSHMAVEKADNSMAGSYSVVVSNNFGSIESPAAVLTVRTNFIAPALTAAALNDDSTISFAISGEPLTYYRIQSSSNLVDWADERTISLQPPHVGFTSVILSKELTTTINVPFSDQSKFFRAVLYQPTFNRTNGTYADSQHCINNLRMIRFAKEFWGTEYDFQWSGLQFWAYGTDSELHWWTDISDPHCTSDDLNCLDSVYALNNVTTDPVCSVDPEHHILEEPPDEY